MDKSKQSVRKSKRSFRRRYRSGDRIDYRNMSLISRFISEQGKILSRRVNRLTLKQQRLITIAIKQARKCDPPNSNYSSSTSESLHFRIRITCSKRNMSSFSNSTCKCGSAAKVQTSWKETNHGRRFLSYPKWPVSDYFVAAKLLFFFGNLNCNKETLLYRALIHADLFLFFASFIS